MNKKETRKKKYTPSFLEKNKKFIITLSVGAVVLFTFFIINGNSFLSGGNDKPLPPNFSASSISEPVDAPSFKLENIYGKNIELSDYKGKVLIVDFWATWCPPCIRGIPDLIELKRKYGSKGFEVIGISVDQDDTKQDVVPFVQSNGINYPVAYASRNVTEKYGGIESIPTSFIIDKRGKIVASFQGLTEKSVYEEYINKLL